MTRAHPHTNAHNQEKQICGWCVQVKRLALGRWEESAKYLLHLSLLNAYSVTENLPQMRNALGSISSTPYIPSFLVLEFVNQGFHNMIPTQAIILPWFPFSHPTLKKKSSGQGSEVITHVGKHKSVSSHQKRKYQYHIITASKETSILNYGLISHSSP